MCMPGDNVEMTIELIHPVAMEQGLTFAIMKELQWYQKRAPNNGNP